jgi:serine/threonine protein kinase
MDYLCNEQIVHRDLRTVHILVGHGNKLKIAGFGMAKRLQNGCYVSLGRFNNSILIWSDGDYFTNFSLVMLSIFYWVNGNMYCCKCFYYCNNDIY